MDGKNILGVLTGLIISLTGLSAHAQWTTPILSGTLNDATTDYLNTANWISGTINDTFVNNPVPGGAANIYFNADYTTGTIAGTGTTLGYGLYFGYGGNNSLTLLGGGTNNGATASDHTLTLAGDVYLGNAGTPVTIIGGTVAGTFLNVNLNGTRTFTGLSGKNIRLLNTVSNGSIIVDGGINLQLSGTNNTFSGGILVKNGSLSSFGNTTGNYFGTGTITLGDSSGTFNTTLNHANGSTTITNAILIAGGNSGTASIAPGSGNNLYSGAITLQNHDLRIAPSSNGGNSFSGGITGTGNLLIQQSAAGTTTTFTGGTLNFVGSITNTSNQGKAVLIQSIIGNKVTSITQSGSLSMVISGSNSYSGGTFIQSGTLGTGSVSYTGNVITSWNAGTGNLGTGNVLVADVTGAALVLGNNVSINDFATLSFGQNSVINLNFTGTETVGQLFVLTDSSYLNLVIGQSYTAMDLNNALDTLLGTSGLTTFQGTGSLIVSIPEPSIWTLLAFGAGLLATLGYTRRRKA